VARKDTDGLGWAFKCYSVFSKNVSVFDENVASWCYEVLEGVNVN
jgi:hypothetical protein